MNLIEIEQGIFIDPKFIIKLDVKLWQARYESPSESAVVTMARNEKNLSTRFHITGLKVKEILSNPDFTLTLKEQKENKRTHATEVHLIYK